MASTSKNILTVSYGTSTTLSEKKEIKCIFNDFESLEVKKKYETPMFECHGHKWTLGIYPWGETSEAKKNKMVSVYLYPKTTDQPTRVKFTLTIGNVTKSFDHRVTVDGRGWSKFMSRSEALESLDKNGALTCKVTIQGWFQSTNPSWRPEHPMMDKLSKIYNSEDGSDVSFVFHGGNIVRANSHVLAIQCPSLYEIVQEAGDRAKIEIENTDADLFGLMVRFMHYENLPESLFDLKTQGMDLLKMADRFDFPELKMTIEADLVDSALKVENAADFLILADGHSCALLKEAAIDTIIQNFAEVMKTKGWAKLSDSRDLLNEVLQIKHQVDNSTSGETVSALRKKLAERGQDVDGTKEMLVKRLE